MNQQLLNKFFEGNCSPEELEIVLTWYSSGEAGTMLEEEISAGLNEKYGNKDSSNWNKDLVFEKLAGSIENFNSTSKNSPKTETTNSSNSFFVRNSKFLVKVSGIAASLIIMLGIGWWLGAISQKENQNSTLTEVQEYVTKQALEGQKLSFVLSDGTQIKLNSKSKIWFKKNFSNAKLREVHLEGEAFFNVAKDSLKPFIIYTDGVETTVLGTSFNIKANQDERFVDVAVLTGKVMVNINEGGQSQDIFLQPGEKLSCDKDRSQNAVKVPYDYEEEMAWKDGVIHFKNADFKEIKSRLERWYGKKFIVENRTIQKTITGTYKDKSLQEVLDGISYILDFKYEIKDDLVLIK